MRIASEEPRPQEDVVSSGAARHEVASCEPCVVPAFLVRGVWDELATRGISMRELERLSGMTRPQRDDFSSALSEHDVHRLYEVASVLTGDATLGISVGSALSIASLHLVGQLIVSSLTLRQAIELAMRATPNARERALWLEEVPEERVRFGHLDRGRNGLGARVDAELTAVLLSKLAGQFLGGHEVLSVQFAFPAPLDASAYLGAFPGGAEFCADGTFVVIPRVVLDRRRSGVDPALARQLFQLAQEQYGTAHTEGADWTYRVRRALRTQRVPRLVAPQAIADQLGLSPRGLSRRLAREGVSFSTLVDELLYIRARALLRRPTATSKEVAAALGYAELSSFFRAFRRWSGGLTPSQYRAQQTTDNGEATMQT